MRYSLYVFLLLITTSLTAQTLPITFESDVTTADFTDFDGGTATVVPNPQPAGLNPSVTVARIIRDGGAIFAGSKITLDNDLDFSTDNGLSMLVYTTAPVGTTVKFKLEGNGSAERDVQTTVSGEWELLTWDFTGTPMNFNDLVFMFDFGATGNGSANSTFFFDEVRQVFGGAQIDWPVDFESDGINYTTTDFDGPVSTLIADPTNPNNKVVQVVKNLQSGASSGTTIGTPAGFATDLPLTLTDSKMNVRVWSPTAGTPVRLKVEDSDDPTHTVETQTLTTVAQQWEVLEFDFTQQAPGTESLAVGLSMGWRYNMASIFFNFGTDGATAGEQTYYFDDVRFGDATTGVASIAPAGFSVFPNPAEVGWTLSNGAAPVVSVTLFDSQGRQLGVYVETGTVVFVPAGNLEPGYYTALVSNYTSTWTACLIRR